MQNQNDLDPAGDEGGQPSQGPSGSDSVEPLGGADAVPETPDNVPADQDLRIRESNEDDGLRGSTASTDPLSA